MSSWTHSNFHSIFYTFFGERSFEDKNHMNLQSSINLNSNLFQWHHKYDTSGNLINADYGTGNTSREYEFGERVANIDGLFVSYDKDGRQVKRHNLSFLYNDFSKLVEVKESGKSTLSFYYDDLQRLMVKFDFTTLETTTFFYTLKDKVNL